MNTTEINGVTYNVNKMDAFEQMHVARRILPILPHLVQAFASKPGAKTEDAIMSIALGGFADSFAKMSNEDVNYVTQTCLSACQRKQGKAYAKVMVNGTLQFQDIELDTLLGLTLACIVENLGRFFPTSQPESPATE